MVLVVVGALAEGRSFPAEQRGVECFGDEEDASEDSPRPDEENIEGPAPK